MNEQSSVKLLQAYREGDECAGHELFNRYTRQLIALAARQLSPALAQRIDPEDIVQSACLVFVQGLQNGRFTLKERGDLLKLLSTITVLRAKKHVERNTTLKRNPAGEEAGMDEAEIMSKEPSPDNAAAFADEVESLLARRKLAWHQDVVQRMLQGYTSMEIAQATGHTTARIRQIANEINRELAQRAQRLRDGDEA